jgi:hypothetical protein
MHDDDSRYELTDAQVVDLAAVIDSQSEIIEAAPQLEPANVELALAQLRRDRARFIASAKGDNLGPVLVAYERCETAMTRHVLS